MEELRQLLRRQLTFIILTYLNTPDNRCLVFTRRCQITSTMAPLEVPYLVGVYLKDGSSNARERVTVAGVVRV